MNIGQVKILSWGSAGLLAGGLGLYVFLFITDLEQKRSLPNGKDVEKVLEAVQPVKAKASDLVSYEDIRRLYLPSCERCKDNKSCRHLNWTGKAPPPPPTAQEPTEPVKPPKVPVAELIRIAMVQVDLAGPSQSFVFMKYRPKAGVQSAGAAGGFVLHEGDRLASPHDGIRVEKIAAEGVAFAFDEEGREGEIVTPSEFDLKTMIVQVGPDGVVMPKVAGIPKGDFAPWRPAQTKAFGQNRYMLGTEDIAYANEHYAEIVANDVRTARHQDKRTGKYDGIEIKAVTPGSYVERHGGQEGDIIKSINGHPVTSVQEAINYAKMNANQFTTWEVVIERNGKLQTLYYQSPQQ
jgi:hypothetical protein